MQYQIKKFSDLDKARTAAHKRSKLYGDKIQKDLRELKKSFAPLSIISNVTGALSSPSLSWVAIALTVIRKAKKAIK